MTARVGPWFWIPLAGAALLLSAALSVGLGATGIGVADAAGVLWAQLSGKGPEGATAGIILNIRLPRILLATLVGALLAVSGAIMQAFFRNIMAGPYLVGVSSGAALGAVSAMLMGWGIQVGMLTPVPLCAFVGAMVVVTVVYGLNRRHGRLHTEGLLLTGIAISAAITSIVAVMILMSRDGMDRVLFWLLGSLAAARWDHVELLVPYAGVGLLVVWYLARDLDALMWGDVTAAALGVRVERSRTILLAVASLMTAAAVAVTGVIGFVGLMVPHIARFLVGSMHRPLLPLTAILGALLIVWADVLARMVWAPVELPLGAITALVGAPFLVYLCTRRS